LQWTKVLGMSWLEVLANRNVVVASGEWDDAGL
jgi:hypothetical protein